MEAKYSLDMFKNNETINMWGELFNSLMEGREEYRKLQKKLKINITMKIWRNIEWKNIINMRRILIR